MSAYAMHDLALYSDAALDALHAQVFASGDWETVDRIDREANRRYLRATDERLAREVAERNAAPRSAVVDAPMADENGNAYTGD